MKRQSGFGVIAVIVVLVMLAALAGGLVALGSTQSVVLSQDVLSARAEQSARAGVQWGLFQAFNGTAAWDGASCDTATLGNPTFNAPVRSTINMAAINGFQVTVECGSAIYRDGETGSSPPNNHRMVRVYQIRAFACPVGATPCPRNDGTTAGFGYVERRREAVGI